MVDGEVIKQSVLGRRFAEQKLTTILGCPLKPIHIFTQLDKEAKTMKRKKNGQKTEV